MLSAEALRRRAEEQLDDAEALLLGADARRWSVHTEASAVLIRLALEDTMAAFWIDRGLDLGALAMRSQLVAFACYLDDEYLANNTRRIWLALSELAHHRVYRSAPSVAEVEGHLVEARELLIGTWPARDQDLSWRAPISRSQHDFERHAAVSQNSVTAR